VAGTAVAAADSRLGRICVRLADAAMGLRSGESVSQFTRFEPDFTRFEPDFTRFEPDFTRFEPELTRLEPDFTRLEPDFTRVWDCFHAVGA
jgi:hypothetical protein